MFAKTSSRPIMIGTLGLMLLLGSILATPAESALPDWVQNPPQDTDQYLYGIGQSTNRDAAINGGLKEVAGKLSTWVKGSTEQSVTEEADAVANTFQENIQSRVQEVNFNNYDIMETTQSDGLTYVLLRVDRDQLIDNLQSQLGFINSELANTFKEMDESPGLRELFRMQEAMSQIDTAVDFLEILSSLNEDFDNSKASHYRDRYRAYREVYRQTRTNTKIVITAPVKLETLANHLSKRLAQNNFNTTVSSSADSDQAQLNITGELNCQELMGDKVVDLQVWLEVLDSEGTQLSNQNYSTSATSLTSHEDALRVAIEEVQSEVRTAELSNLIGF